MILKANIKNIIIILLISCFSCVYANNVELEIYNSTSKIKMLVKNLKQEDLNQVNLNKAGNRISLSLPKGNKIERIRLEKSLKNLIKFDEINEESNLVKITLAEPNVNIHQYIKNENLVVKLQKIHSDKPIMYVGYENENKQHKLIFPGHNLGAAIFKRDDYLWFVFDEKMEVDISAANKLNELGTLRWKIANNEGSTILSTSIKNANLLDASFENNSWIVTFSTDPKDMIFDKDYIYSTILEKDYSISSEIKGLSPKKFKIIDPYIGDELEIVTFKKNLFAYPERKFVPFELLPSVQGMGIVKIQDQFALTIKDNIIKFNFYQFNSILSNRAIEDIPILDLTEWGNKTNLQKNYLISERLKRQLANSDGKDEMLYYLSLAKLYMNMGYHKEASGILDLIKIKNKDFAEKNNINLLKAINYYLDEKFELANEFFSLVEEGKLQPEIVNSFKLWKALNDIASYKENDYIKNLYGSKNQIKNKQLISRAFLSDLKFRVDLGQTNRASEIIDKIKEKYLYDQEQTDKLKPFLDLYSGMISYKNKDFAAAKSLWKKYENDDKLPKKLFTEINFNLVKLLYETGEKKIDDAIQNLMKLSINWRGDELEKQILLSLADLYYNNKQYSNSLRSLKTILNYFPENMDSLKLTARMGKLFREILSDLDKYNISELEAMALFFEFRELMPPGEVGNVIIDNLARKLIKLDLLKDASRLLESQLNFSSLRLEDKMPFINKLAAIYILDKNPKKALEIINAYEKQIYDIKYLQEMNYLKISALIEDKKFKEAREYLDESRNNLSNGLLMELYWQSKNWGSLASLIESLFTYYNSRILSPSQEELALKLAVTYSELQDKKNLDRIREIFLDKFTNKDMKNKFDILTANLDNIGFENYRNKMSFEELQMLSNSFKQDLREKYLQ